MSKDYYDPNWTFAKFIILGVALLCLAICLQNCALMPLSASSLESTYRHIDRNLIYIHYHYHCVDIFGKAHRWATKFSGVWIDSDLVLTVCHGATERPPGYFYATIDLPDGPRSVQFIIEQYDLQYDLLLLRSNFGVPWETVQIAKSLTMGEDMFFGGYNSAAFPKIRYIKYLQQNRWGIPLSPIYHGDSGGGVFNSSGELVGIIRIMFLVPRKETIQCTFTGYACPLEAIQQFLEQ